MGTPPRKMRARPKRRLTVEQHGDILVRTTPEQHAEIREAEAEAYDQGIHTDKYLPSALLPHPEWRPAAFTVTDASMSPRFNSGDILILADALTDVRTDDILLIGLKVGVSALRQIRIIDAENWELRPLDPRHTSTTIKRDQIEWFAPVMVRIEPLYLRRGTPWTK